MSFAGAGAGPLQWVFLGELLPPDYKVIVKILVKVLRGSFLEIYEIILGSGRNNGFVVHPGNLCCDQSIPLHSGILHRGSWSLLVGYTKSSKSEFVINCCN